MSLLDDRSKQDFLIYANSVIKSRAISFAADNLKPVHRKILWTLYEDKVYDNSKTKKCATEVGRVLAYHPHGDAAVYGALVRLSQWWKLRYPLVEMQGNCGNILGDGPAASRYTECRLSKIGMFMLEDINKNCVDFHPNYDNTTEEPTTLPSKFPYILCGNNSGIAVGMGSDIVSHNFTEVVDAIKYYMEHKDCSIADLMQFIKGPDFPTGGKIINGEELLDIYTRGTGSVKICAHYDIVKKNNKTLVTFHDLPYGVEIDSGVKKPLKKLVLDEGYDVFEDITVNKAGPHNFDITITLAKGANVNKCLEILFAKTKLQSSVKINQNFIIDGEPKLLNLKQIIEYWVNYRSSCITKIAATDYAKTNHKLTITLGLQKCMSNIDRVIEIVRYDNMSKTTLMKEFELNDEQATAVLEMKLSRLNRLEIEKLNKDAEDLKNTLKDIQDIIDNEKVRYDIILKDLAEIKKAIGKDERLTEIYYSGSTQANFAAADVKKEFRVTSVGNAYSLENEIMPNEELMDVVFACGPKDIYGYTKTGEICSLVNKGNADYIGACVLNPSKTKVICVTKNGNIKLTEVKEYRLGKSEKALKLKDDDELKFLDFCGENDYLMLFNGENVLKLAIKDLPLASKLTLGVKSGFTSISAAAVVSDSDVLLFATQDMKGKLTSVKDFSIDSRGNKGQSVAEKTVFMKKFEDGREVIYLIPKIGKMFTVQRNKVSIKSRTASGASLTSRAVSTIL